MFNLVLWSFVVAITPVAFGLTWKLISGVGDLVALRLSQALDNARAWGHPHTLHFDSPSVCLSRAKHSR